VSVSDCGRGISLDFLPHVFDPFRQGASRSLNREGLGLGLAIARQLVERHGGGIYAESGGEGMGATFTVSLRRTDAASAV
jgi:signal transduction histidine kinase